MELLRTMMFVPGNRVRMIEKAKGLSPDALIFDLEDAVPPAEKATAGQMVREALTSGAFGHIRTFVRVNALSTGLLPTDLDAVVVRELYGIVLPKVEDPEGVAEASRLLEEREARLGLPVGQIRILPIIETVRGVLGLPRVAGCSPRFVGLSFGIEDFATDLGVQRSQDAIEALYPRISVALHARATDMPAIDTVYANVEDVEGLEKDALLARQLGFRGKLVLHPRQIDVVNRVFTPSTEEIEYARKVVAAYDEAEARGEASVAVDGKMVDIPIAVRARALIAMAEKIAAAR